jgi:hypothetical protein
MRSHKKTLAAVTVVSGLAISTFAFAQTTKPGAPGTEGATNPGATDSIHGQVPNQGPRSTTGAGSVGSSGGGAATRPMQPGQENVTNPGAQDSIHGQERNRTR